MGPRSRAALVLCIVGIIAVAGIGAWEYLRRTKDGDGDGIPDYLEVERYHTDPNEQDLLLAYALKVLPEVDALAFKEVEFNDSSKGTGRHLRPTPCPEQKPAERHGASRLDRFR